MKKAYRQCSRNIACPVCAVGVEGCTGQEPTPAPVCNCETKCSEDAAMERFVPEMAKKEGVNEALKAADPMRWVGLMNNIHNRAEEIVLTELAYD